MKHLCAFFAICTLRRECSAFHYRFNRDSKSINASSSLSGFDKKIFAASFTRPSSSLQEQATANAIALRGGACSDSTPALFGKVASSASVETVLMYRLLSFGAQINTSKSSGKWIVQAVLALTVVFGSSYFGQLVDNGMSAATRQVLAPNEIPGDADWYLNLKKPSWNPPGWLFPIMWLVVSKPTQFVAVWKLMTNDSEKDLLLPFIVYCSHLSLGDAWNKVFFGLQCIGRGVAVISTFWSVLLWSALLFYKVDPSAGIFLLPTCLWVTVAAALNWSIYFLNKISK